MTIAGKCISHIVDQGIKSENQEKRENGAAAKKSYDNSRHGSQRGDHSVRSEGRGLSPEGVDPLTSKDCKVTQVGADVAEAAGQCFGSRAAEVLRPDGTGHWLFDLWTANRIVLRQAGLRDENIHVAAEPTGAHGSGQFFSDREARPCGRFAAIARLHPRSAQ